MYKKKLIDLSLKKFLTHYHCEPPKIYGLPKIHKNDLPFRPVVSSIKSLTYALSKFMVGMLSHIRNDDINTRSSQSLPKKLSNLHLDHESMHLRENFNHSVLETETR